jgi:predicted permease
VRPAPQDDVRANRLRERQDLDEEIAAHLAHRVDDLVSRGLTTEEARARAREEFGDADRVRTASRNVRDRARRRRKRSSAFETARQDVSFALRQVRHGRGFALTALVTLMLGVGAAVTITSVVTAVVFDPLPFDEPERVVFAEMVTPAGQSFAVSEAAFLDWRREVRSFRDAAAFANRAGTLRRPGQPSSISVGHVSHSLLDVLGVRPVLGRAFRASDDLPGTEASVALISHAMWRTDFAGDPTVLDTSLDVDGRLLQIVGVLPDGLDVLLGDTPVFVTLRADPTSDRGDHDVDVVARLASGVSFDVARSELADVQERLSRTHAADLGWSAQLHPARSVLIGETVERAGWILIAAAIVLLVMACVNVSNFLMVRSTARRTEMALRTALGASQGRLVRQLFTESSLLAAVGGSFGLALATMALPALRAAGGGRIPRLETAQIDPTALFVGVLAIALATLVCGLAPVVQLRTDRLSSSMVGRGGAAGDPGGRLRSALVTAQVALTVLLLSGTGLLLRSFVELTAVDPGFEAEGTLAFSVDMPDGSWSFAERAELIPLLRDAVSSIPGVRAVGATAVEPFSGSALGNFVAPEDRLPDRASDFTPIQWRVVTPGFFEAMGMELLAGRDFTESDDWENGTPIVIGESLARQTWGAESPLDRELVWGDPEGSRMRVVGVVEDLRDVELGQVPSPIVYRPHRQISWAVMTMVVRYDGDAAAITAAIRGRVPETVPGLPVGEVESLGEKLRRAVAEPRFNLQILSWFAVVGLLLALIGVYGLTAFDVRRRYPEIGIRLSLGARPEAIRSMILRQRMRLTLVGIVVGLGVAWLASGAMRSLLYGIAPGDPLTWLCVTLVIVVTSLAATYLPTRHAIRVDPSRVLNG